VLGAHMCFGAHLIRREHRAFGHGAAGHGRRYLHERIFEMVSALPGTAHFLLRRGSKGQDSQNNEQQNQTAKFHDFLR
jgi:hypothetical protein